MTNRRTRSNREPSNLNWLKYSVVGFCILLLLTSFFLEKDPKSVLNDIYQYALGNKEKITKNDHQWEVFLLEKDNHIDSLNSVIDSYKLRTIPEFAKVKTTSTGLNLRSLPSTDSDVIAKIPDGTEVQLYYRDNELSTIGSQSGYWVKVNFNDTVGFVFSTYLAL